MLQKNIKGITLIALIITIIILLILAGISIATLTGENGILSKADIAKEQTKISEYYEKIEMVRTELRLENENFKNPTLTQLQEEFKNNQTNWVETANIEQVEGTEKLVLTTKEGYIFYITETKTEYKGKGKVVDTSALNKKEALNLEIVGNASNGKLVKITDLSGVDYYKIEYQINSQDGEWLPIESGETVEVGYSSTIHARLTYGPSKGTIVSLSIDASNPTITAKSVDTNNYTRKTETAISNLFDIIWGSDGVGSIEYSITGNLKFKNTKFPNTKINNLSELELGNYTITCTITSPSKKTATATKEVKVTKLASTNVINENDSNKSEEAVAIYSSYDLAYFRDLVNTENQISLNAKMMNNIDLALVCGETLGSWEPIGKVTGLLESYITYEGIFDGDNTSISNLYIKSQEAGLALFGVVQNKGTVKNLTVDGEVTNTASSHSYNLAATAGIVSAYWNNTEDIEQVHLKNLHNKVNVTAINSRNVAGVVGEFHKTKIENCSNSSKITGYFDVGGIVGSIYDNAEIYRCYNTGEISAEGGQNISGNSYLNSCVRRNCRASLGEI